MRVDTRCGNARLSAVSVSRIAVLPESTWQNMGINTRTLNEKRAGQRGGSENRLNQAVTPMHTVLVQSWQCEDLPVSNFQYGAAEMKRLVVGVYSILNCREMYESMN